MRTIYAAVAAAFAVISTAAAHEFTAGDLVIEHPWAPPTLAGVNQGAAYLTIRNDSDEPDRLLSASTPIAGRAELHAHVMTDGVAAMTRQADVIIPPHAEVAFEPGGLHVMLFDVTEPLTPDARAPLTLEFERAGTVDVILAVQTLADYLGRQAGGGDASAPAMGH